MSGYPSGGGVVAAQPSFAGFVARARAAGELVVQPRMGFGRVADMRAGLAATRAARARAAGTITLDSYTRVGDHASARRAVRDGADLNGFPLVAEGAATTRAMLAGLRGPEFPVQVRHGSALPGEIFRTLVDAGVDATEGGPVSYCLPYSRVPLARSVDAWARACELFAARPDAAATPHLESFGGCLLGQLCPPSLLVAMSVLEGLFFAEHGIRSVSLSYAQQTNPAQDAEAIGALRRLAAELLGDLDWHVVLYTYMGVYPRTRAGAASLLADSARLAVHAGAERLIVKTVAEAHRIPTVTENLHALELAAAVAAATTPGSGAAPDTGLYAEARSLVLACLELAPDTGRALLRAFERGYLDVPFCLHADNAGRARSAIADDGRLCWTAAGSLPIRVDRRPGAAETITSAGLVRMLSFVQRRYDQPHELGGRRGLAPAAGAGRSPARLLTAGQAGRV